MSYVVKNEGISDQAWNIVEKDTGLSIWEETTKEAAKRICRQLNLGAGFNGFTPEFFTYEYKEVK